MPYYLSHGEFQQHLKAYYMKTGNRLQFTEMTDYLYHKGLLTEGLIPSWTPYFYEDMDDDAFTAYMNTLPVPLFPKAQASIVVQETDIIPDTRDLLAIYHFCYTRPQPHTHDFFEIDYVAKGHCFFTFEKSTRLMNEGELCIIAPNSVHDIYTEEDAVIFTILLRKSTFDTTFFSLLSQKDLLAYFFRTILHDSSHANYLQFFAKGSKFLTRIARNLIGESQVPDNYSNSNCISWMNLFFSALLRNYSQTLRFYNYPEGSDFSLVLKYIQHNYQTLTLSALAKFFHYSEPHLSTLIKQNTGYTFTDLIKRLRIADAINYLTNTELKISEIAARTGYHSADHFSRIFRSVHQISPQQYRSQNKQAQLSPESFFF